MLLHKVFVLISLIISLAASSPLSNDVFADLLQHTQAIHSKDSVLVKRRIFEDNPDGQLKQIPLSSLVGDLEKTIVASALSFNKVLENKETKINDLSERDVNERQTLTKEAENIEQATTTELSDILPVTEKVVLSTTEKFPQSSGVPTHIVIDRIAMQPHTGGYAVIPFFEQKHIRKENDRDIAKITISKTEIKSLPGTSDSSSSSSTTPASTHSASTTTDTTLQAITTPKNIEQLKEDAEELKEKVAEIEAEPFILSARV